MEIFLVKMKECRIRAKVYNMWTPAPKYSNDCNIMEYAVKDLYNQKQDKYRLISINRCRTYTRCYYIGDMNRDENNCIDPAYLTGEKQWEANKYAFPTNLKPTSLQWSEWKSFIYRNSLTGAYKINPPLQQWNQNQGFNPNCLEPERMLQLQRAHNMMQMFHTLPN